jgi:hypothetical protein
MHSAKAALIPGVACSRGIFVITSSRAARIVWINAGLKLGMGASPQLRRHSRQFLAQRQEKVS